jgi:hypothetical protein
MIEEEEDEDVHRMNIKDKLSSNSNYILESGDDDKQILYGRQKGSQESEP